MLRNKPGKLLICLRMDSGKKYMFPESFFYDYIKMIRMQLYAQNQGYDDPVYLTFKKIIVPCIHFK